MAIWRYFGKKQRINFPICLKMSIFALRLEKVTIYNRILSTARRMTKADIINEIVEKTGVGKRDVSAVVEELMSCIKSSMMDRKENVYLRGFGSFVVKQRASKKARNISKDSTIVIPAHLFPAFKPAKSFIERMKEVGNVE